MDTHWQLLLNYSSILAATNFQLSRARGEQESVKESRKRFHLFLARQRSAERFKIHGKTKWNETPMKRDLLESETWSRRIFSSPFLSLSLSHSLTHTRTHTHTLTHAHTHTRTHSLTHTLFRRMRYTWSEFEEVRKLVGCNLISNIFRSLLKFLFSCQKLKELEPNDRPFNF